MNTVVTHAPHSAHVTDMKAIPASASGSTVNQRVDTVDWRAVEESLDQYGNAMLPVS